jgi:hypothetical protein
MRRLLLTLPVAVLAAACSKADPPPAAKALPDAAAAAAPTPPPPTPPPPTIAPPAIAPPAIAPPAIAPPPASPPAPAPSTPPRSSASAPSAKAALEAEAKRQASMLFADDEGGQPRQGGARPITSTPKVIVRMEGRIAVVVTATGETSLAAELVQNKTRSAYLAGLHRCYREELKHNPEGQGTMSLGLTVSEAGRVAVTTAPPGISAQLDACVAQLAGKWRFPPPLDADSAPTTAGFTMALTFTPIGPSKAPLE